MRRPPRPLWEEEETLTQALIEIFFSPLSEEERNREMSEEEEQEFNKTIERWMDEHASEEMKLYWEYCNWVGDEGQLCDGKGHILLSNPEDPWSWIQDWDVNEDGYCLFEGTQELILNADGTPIKNPVLDKRVSDLYEKY